MDSLGWVIVNAKGVPLWGFAGILADEVIKEWQKFDQTHSSTAVELGPVRDWGRFLDQGYTIQRIGLIERLENTAECHFCGAKRASIQKEESDEEA